MGWGQDCYKEKQKSNDTDYCKTSKNPFGCKKLFFPEIDSQYFAITSSDVWDYNPIGYFRINKQKATAMFKVNKEFFKEVKERFNNYKDCPVFPMKTFEELENKIKEHMTQIPEKINLKSSKVILNTITDEQYIWVDELKGWVNLEEAKYSGNISRIYKNLNNLPDVVISIIYVPMKPLYKGTLEADSKNRIDDINIKVKNKRKLSLKPILSFLYFFTIGLWLGIFWITASILLILTIIGLPIGKRMLKKTKFIMFLTK